jgi:GNAT superfamily N-acetyltransferase
MYFKTLKVDEVDLKLFEHFQRHQTVTHCWRKIAGTWCIQEVSFTNDWNKEEYLALVTCLKSTITSGGIVFGVFWGEILKGFASVESAFFGTNNEYLDLSSLHVSKDMRGKGIGKELFHLAKTWAKEHGATKLYISAHSAVESQAFYRALDCEEAHEYSQFHVENEPYDCQLECKL